MKKSMYLIYLFALFLILVPIVNADKGDIVYQIDKVSISDNYITITGWSFVHETHNYVSVYKLNSNGSSSNTLLKSNGGQKTKIKISNASGTKELVFEDEHENDNYNFYYQMYDYDTYYGVNTYNDVSMNNCGSEGRCYYEDLGFEIKIKVSDILNEFSSNESVYFYIAACNNDYGKCSDYDTVRVVNVNDNSEFIDIQSRSSGKVKFIANGAKIQNLYLSQKFCNGGQEYPCSDDYTVYGKTGTYYHILKNGLNSSYVNGFYTEPSNVCTPYPQNECFLQYTLSPGKFAFCIDVSTGADACDSYDGNGYCTSCKSLDNVQKLAAYGSWVQLDGQFIIKVKDINRCDPVIPSSGSLTCNGSNTYESTCDKLTVVTDSGTVDVKIEQKGYISSVLTPETTYAGGGFSFGVMYTNSIKWSYYGSAASGNLHTAVTDSMNNKLKNVVSYISGINLSQISFGGKTIDSSFLVKKCSSSNTNIDYYNKELTVSCTFYIPDSVLKANGLVTYSNGIGSSITNKYYTPLDYNNYNGGEYNIKATITGMNRITDNAAEADSRENGEAWTGIWEDEFEDCSINLYPLIYKGPDDSNDNKVVYNFIYRPIDINNPFPNRNAGINWYDWYSIVRNQERLESTYDSDNLEYSITLDNETIADIKNYNKNNGSYLEWNSISDTGKSSFIDEYVTRK